MYDFVKFNGEFGRGGNSLLSPLFLSYLWLGLKKLVTNDETGKFSSFAIS